MSLKLLSLIFKIGNILALTPSSLELKKIKVIRTLYILTNFALLTAGHVYSLFENDFFFEYIHIKVVLCFLNEFSIYGLNFYCIIIIGLFKREVWKYLIENLHATSYLVKEKKSKLPYYFNFVLITTLHIASSLYVIYIGLKIDGLLYIRQDAMAHYPIFLDFFNKFVFCTVLEMLLLRYKGLQRILETFLEKGNQHSKVPTILMKNMSYTMCFLNKTVAIYNDLFAWPTFLIISFTTLEILNVIDFAMFYHQDLEIYDNIVVNATLLVWIFVSFLLLLTKFF